MPVLADRRIDQVSIIDDNQEVREAYEEAISEARFDPVPENGPLPADVSACLDFIQAHAQAGISDHRLRLRNYSRFDGAELVARSYERHFPMVLCTRWERADLADIRHLLPSIPALLTPDDLDPDSLTHALEFCISELDKGFSPERRPWRTQVHVLEVADGNPRTVAVELPAWTSEEIIRLRMTDLPPSADGRLVEGFRCHARVNLDAKNSDDLYFTDWEID